MKMFYFRTETLLSSMEEEAKEATYGQPVVIQKHVLIVEYGCASRHLLGGKHRGLQPQEHS